MANAVVFKKRWVATTRMFSEYPDKSVCQRLFDGGFGSFAGAMSSYIEAIGLGVVVLPESLLVYEIERGQRYAAQEGLSVAHGDPEYAMTGFVMEVRVCSWLVSNGKRALQNRAELREAFFNSANAFERERAKQLGIEP